MFFVRSLTRKCHRAHICPGCFDVAGNRASRRGQTYLTSKGFENLPRLNLPAEKKANGKLSGPVFIVTDYEPSLLWEHCMLFFLSHLCFSFLFSFCLPLLLFSKVFWIRHISFWTKNIGVHSVRVN